MRRGSTSWNPGQYLKFGDERARPFYELIDRIGATGPARVVDIGCGPGELTLDLTRRWPAADVTGVDSSPDMIAAARELLASQASPPRLRFELMDAADWKPGEPVDVIVSNATLQWVPEHESLLARWAADLAPGGALALQVPANYDQPVHVIMRELISSPRWRPLLGEVDLTMQSADPARYLELLSRAGCTVDAWETTYLHVLTGADPVLNWVKGTGLRPVLSALDASHQQEFLAEYGQLLRTAYPERDYGTVLGFRRVFAVARR